MEGCIGFSFLSIEVEGIRRVKVSIIKTIDAT